ncbi:MAG: hypothetical protein ACERLB_04470 [Gammaproteobacteria bacterium]
MIEKPVVVVTGGNRGVGGANADRSLEQGVDTAIWLVTSTDGSPSGGFYRDRKPIDW